MFLPDLQKFKKIDKGEKDRVETDLKKLNEQIAKDKQEINKKNITKDKEVKITEEMIIGSLIKYILI